MNTHRLLIAPCVCIAAMLAGCADDGPVPPAGATCNEVIDAGDSGSTLSAALDQAQAGDCVVAESHTFQGSFALKAGVLLLAAEGATPAIEGAAEGVALTVAGDPGSLVQGFTIHGGKIGVLVEGTQAALHDLEVTGASTGVAAFRDVALGGPDTLPADGITLQAVDIAGNGAGLWASNVRIALEGGSIHDNGSDNLTGGYGLVALAGTQLLANATTVQNNAFGVVIDGAEGTTGQLIGVEVLGNVERGVWAQKLAGTVAAPALTLDGALIDQNSLVGFGAAQSKGIIIIGGKISGTLNKPIFVEATGMTEPIGDGVSLTEGTGEAKLDGVSIENNQRSQGVIDQGAAGIIIIGGKVEATGEQHKVVVQNTTEMVEAPPEYLTTGVTLPVAATLLTIPDAVP